MAVIPLARRRRSDGVDTALTLAQLDSGDLATVAGLDGALPAAIRARLVDLGFDEGAEVTMLRRAPLGDPCIFRVRDYDVCLRRREAGAILCAPAGGRTADTRGGDR